MLTRMLATLSREHRRFLLVDEIIGSMIINFPLNGGIAWLMFRSADSVPFWGWSSIAADTLATAFALPFLTALFATRHARAQVVRGKLPPIPCAAVGGSAWWERSSFTRGAILGAAAMVLVATPVLTVFVLIGPAQLSRASFIWFKAIFATSLGVLVTPLIGWWALREASQRHVGLSP